MEADVFSASVDTTDTVSYPSFRKRGGGAQPDKRGGARPACSSLNRSGEAVRALRARQASFPALCCVCLLTGFLGFAPETAAQSTGNEVTVRVDVPEYVVEGETGTVTVTLSKALSHQVDIHLQPVTLDCDDTIGGAVLNGKYTHTIDCPGGAKPIGINDVDFPIGWVVFPAGTTVKTFSLEAVDDAESDSPELAAIDLAFRDGVQHRCPHCTIDSATPADGWTTVWPDSGPDRFYWFVPILDEAPGMDRSTDNLTVQEGSSNTYTVKLATHPVADAATVTLDVPDGTDLTVDTDPDTDDDQNTLSFTASNWNEYSDRHCHRPRG